MMTDRDVVITVAPKKKNPMVNEANAIPPIPIEKQMSSTLGLNKDNDDKPKFTKKGKYLLQVETNPQQTIGIKIEHF